MGPGPYKWPLSCTCVLQQAEAAVALCVAENTIREHSATGLTVFEQLRNKEHLFFQGVQQRKHMFTVPQWAHLNVPPRPKTYSARGRKVIRTSAVGSSAACGPLLCLRTPTTDPYYGPLLRTLTTDP